MDQIDPKPFCADYNSSSNNINRMYTFPEPVRDEEEAPALLVCGKVKKESTFGSHLEVIEGGVCEEATGHSSTQNETPADNQIFCSHKDKTLSISKLVKCGKKGYSWDYAITTKIDKIKAATTRVFLSPRVSDDDNRQSAKLDVQVEVRKEVMAKLRECRIKVETEVRDTKAGRRIGSTQFQSHAISMEDGQVKFRQDLVSYDEVKRCESDSVALHIKVTISTYPDNGAST